jgi:hypothetical protein
VRTIALGVRPGLQSELGHWIEGSSRFGDFVTAHQDKIRKKLSTTDEEARQDVRAELVVAHALLADRRFELAFEAYGAGHIGPDFSVTFRANQRFNLEVTRLRGIETPDPSRIANVIAGKLRQLPGDRANGLVIAANALTDDVVGAALRELKAHADARDDAFFARRALKTARDAYAQYLYLSAVFALTDAGTSYIENREARRPLPPEALSALTACFAPPG